MLAYQWMCACVIMAGARQELHLLVWLSRAIFALPLAAPLRGDL